MTTLSAFSMFTVFIYLFMGAYTFRQNPKSTIHRVFLILCISYAIWAFGYSFVYLYEDEYIISIWNKIAALGWCSFSALGLYLVLLITENRYIRSKILGCLIFTPAVFFFYLAVFCFGPDIQTPYLITRIFYIGNFIYNFSYVLGSIIIISVWGITANNIRIKKQAMILVISGLIPFFLCLLTQTILPALKIASLPRIGQLYSIIMIIGAYIVIDKYKFLRLPEKFIFEEIMREMLDMTILVNNRGQVIKVNKNTLTMLGYQEEEVIGQFINTLIPAIDWPASISPHLVAEILRFTDISLRCKNNEDIPVNISFTQVRDSKINDLLGALLVIQDLRLINELKKKNLELKEKSIRDSLTGLYNHQYSIDLLEKEIAAAQAKAKYLSVMMLDIDDFKQVNDKFGHQFGDMVLVTIARILTDTIGTTGYVGRYGGEEFIIILPDASLDQALITGEKLRTQVKSHIFARDYTITISIGIRQLEDETPARFIQSADQLLYIAKSKGKDRIESF